VENPQLAAGCGDFVDDEPAELDEEESPEVDVVDVVDEVDAVDEEESLEDEAPEVSLARLSVR
jgi:hypothetical protein